MNGTLTIIHAKGMREVTTHTKPLPLDTLQNAVGGFIEVVPHFDSFEGKRCVAFCNEEGKLRNLPLNAEATGLWNWTKRHGDFLVGSIAIITGDAEFMESL